jgi:hypothetical protein
MRASWASTVRRSLVLAIALGAGLTAAPWGIRPLASSEPGGASRRPIALSVAEGRTRFDLPVARSDSRWLVVASVLSRSQGPYPVRLAATSNSGRPNPPASGTLPGRPDPKPNAPRPPKAPPEPTAVRPPSAREFDLLVRDGDPNLPANYEHVSARLRGLGARVQVYVDSRDIAVVSAETVRDVVTTFDTQVWPTSFALFGPVHDIDGDGRFTILLSRRIGRVGGMPHGVDGYVRGADFDPRVARPLGNRCDMMVLNSALVAGPHLRTVIAHEYAHAVIFCRKVLDAGPGAAGSNEEGWLDEALAHLVEDLHGFSRSNLEHRVRAFLGAPERYRLVVEDYFAADLFRSHGHRGSAYLFLRWCAERHGPSLLPALVTSPLRGIANLEAATGESFDDLFRGWSVALYLDPPAEGGATRPPRSKVLVPGGPPVVGNVAGTASLYVIVEPRAAGVVAVEVTAPREACLAVTLVPLPEDATSQGE